VALLYLAAANPAASAEAFGAPLVHAPAVDWSRCAGHVTIK